MLFLMTFRSYESKIYHLLNKSKVLTFFFGFRTGFRPTNGEQLIRLVRRGMRTGQELFLLGFEPGIPRIRPWNELLATGAQTTLFKVLIFVYNND